LPNRGDIHVNTPLTNLSVAYIQDQKNFIADKVFPLVPVQKQSDRYFVYDKGDLFRDEAVERAPGTESAGGDYDSDNTPSYYCPVFAFHKDVDDNERANSDTPLRPDEDATIFVTQKHLIKRDVLWANSYFKAGIWSTELSGVAADPGGANQILKWSAAGSAPVKDVQNYITAVSELTGYVPNTVVLGAYVYTLLQNHPDIMDRIKYTQRGVVTEDILASLWGVDKVLVPRSVINTAAKGKITRNQFIHGNHVLITYAAPNPGIRVPSAGYTFAWQGLFGAQAYGMRMKSFRMEHLESDRIEGEMAFDQKMVCSDLAVFLKDMV
jgi:hypothetical protein